MRIDPAEFVCFARATQSRDWYTLTRRQPFRFSVENRGIQFVLANGNDRLASNRDIARFCEIYSNAKVADEADFGELFTQSYLRAIAVAFDPVLATFHDAGEVQHDTEMSEGALSQRISMVRERSAEARRACVAIHGSTCVACGISFSDKYGDIAAGFIHVHHLRPLALQAGEHQVNPATDLRPICPNCHAVIHLRGGCMSIEDLKILLHDNRHDGDA